MTLHIDNTTCFQFIDRSLEKISIESLPNHTAHCPHCGVPVRYPTVARKQDIDDFQELIAAAQYVMDKYGITLNLLAEIKATCFAAIAAKKALK